MSAPSIEPTPAAAPSLVEPVAQAAGNTSLTDHLGQAIGELALLLLGAVLLAWVLRMAEQLVRISPLPPEVKASLMRFAPALELVVAVAYLASGLAVLSVHEPGFANILTALVALVIIFAWPALYDLINGVIFRVSQPCEIGDHVRVGDVEGRVIEVRTRALVVQTREGDDALVPYGRLVRQTLRRTQSVSGTHVHAFELEAPVGKDFAEVKHMVLDATMRCHWASVVHEPKVQRRADAIEVSIYAHDADHAPLVEAAVRAALSTAADPFEEPAPAADASGRQPFVPQWPKRS
ncbi:MAG: mechanosensitive ion channel family protein [Deltaproteobacteria bacterium]|nr:mechanosensitive ion channel family protein [Deltaproteobacteria bacterium]